MSRPRWLVLIHSIPPRPAYFRVKVRRRLRKLGAIALKNSVYLLQNSDEATEDLRWLVQEIRTEGGEAILTSAEVIDGPSDGELAARLLGEQGSAGSLPVTDPSVLGEIRGRQWVTRAGIKVDRIASAWLIRSRIDPDASFRFATDRAPPLPGEIRFDMFEGEFTHDGDRCTFEVLIDRFKLGSDRALVALAEVVHDLDCKDDRFRRAETPGIGLLVQGIVQQTAADPERLTAGTELFASLHQAMRANE